VHFIVSMLGFSRRLPYWCTDCEDAELPPKNADRVFEWLVSIPL